MNFRRIFTELVFIFAAYAWGALALFNGRFTGRTSNEEIKRRLEAHLPIDPSTYWFPEPIRALARGVLRALVIGLVVLSLGWEWLSWERLVVALIVLVVSAFAGVLWGRGDQTANILKEFNRTKRLPRH